MLNIILILLTAGLFGKGEDPQALIAQKALKGQSQVFVENKGQIIDTDGSLRNDIKFTTRYQGANIYFAKDGLYYVLQQSKAVEHKKILDAAALKKGDKEYITTTKRIKMHFLNVSRNVEIESIDSVSYSNFYLAHCPDGAMFAVNAKKILYKNLYPNIDLVFYFKENKLEYDYIVYPGGNPADIKFNFQGLDDIKVDFNKILLNTTLATITDQILDVYEINGYQRIDRSCNYKIITDSDGPSELSRRHYARQSNQQLSQNNSSPITHNSSNIQQPLSNNNYITFNIPNYNPLSTLIIDPQLTIEWCTLFGGVGLDVASAGGYYAGLDMDVDGSDNLFISGTTRSTDFPATGGAYQTSLNGGVQDDAFLAKFNSSGVQQWTTYYGSPGNDATSGVVSVAVDGTGDIYFSGCTNNAAFPVLDAGGFYDATKDLTTDMYVVKLATAGTRIWATFIGGNKGESCEPNCIAVDENDNLYIGFNVSAFGGTGYPLKDYSVSGTDYYETIGSTRFLIMFDNTTAQKWGTFFGNSINGVINVLGTDASNNVYVVGATASTGLTLTDDGSAYYDGTRNDKDIYLARFNNIAELKHATYLSNGPSSFDNQYIRDMAFSYTGEYIIVGEYWGASGLPLLDDGTATYDAAYYTTGKAFYLWFNSDGSQKHCTFFANATAESGAHCVAFDSFDNIFISGFAGSITPKDYVYASPSNAYYDASLNGSFDSFILGLNPSGEAKWLTYFGGDADDWATTMVIDNSDNVYIGGAMPSDITNFDITSWTGAYNDNTHNGGVNDIFIARFLPALWPLPIELLNFTANLEKQTCVLNWATATEINNDYFVIERSFDGFRFDSISTVDGAGNSNTALYYEAIDNAPLASGNQTGTHVYYRLKQKDFDGKESLSKAISVNFISENIAAAFSLYPNPSVYGNVPVMAKLKDMKGKPMLLTVYNIIGRQVFSKNFIPHSNNYTFNLGLNTNALQAGTYIIKITNPQGFSLEDRLVVNPSF